MDMSKFSPIFCVSELQNDQSIDWHVSTLNQFKYMLIYREQDYIDSMEGATLSGRQASAYICDAGEDLLAMRKKLQMIESLEQTKPANIPDELSVV